jgi:Glycosyl transferase family 64 domain
MDGQLANFTLLVLTYSERLPLLYKFVRHYSRCASVSEVLIIWNMGEVCVPLGVLDAHQPARCTMYGAKVRMGLCGI